jgi:hypothetical protein
MEDVGELKDVLERIEAKLIAAGKIYSAIQFQIWLIAMVLYYLIIFPLSVVPWQLTAAYWILALIAFAYFSSKIWKRLINLFRSHGKDARSSPAFGMGISLSWICGSIVGWMLIPKTLSDLQIHQSLAIGFLSFISISVFGMFLTFLYIAKSFEKEMIPAFLIPAVAIPAIQSISGGHMVYAGFSIAFAFSLTVIAYLFSAFRTIR